jgi:transcriptional regulator with XRE-family HTH domain
VTEDLLTDEAILAEIGARLARRRIDAGLTQIVLARQAGVSRSTVDRLERGQTTQMSSFIRILRVLELLSQFVELIPDAGPGPMDLLKNKPYERKRAYSSRGKIREDAPKWTWDDES